MFSQQLYESMFSDQMLAINDRFERLICATQCSSSDKNALSEVIFSGRRFRPLLLLLVAEGFGATWKSVLDLGCAVELLHKASLVHDDLVDRDEYRRGIPTIWKKHGSDVAIILGDLLIGLSFELVAESLPASQDCARRVCSLFAMIVKNTSNGELLDLQVEDGDHDIETMLLLKSGTLIAASMEIGAIMAGASDYHCEVCRNIGERLGVAFQIKNDMNNTNELDFVSKYRLGSDLQHGKRNYVTKAYDTANIRPEQMNTLTADMQSQLLLGAVIEMEKNLRMAATHIQELPDGNMKRTLHTLIESASEDWFWVDQDR